MNKFESLTYYLDLNDKGTRTRIECAQLGKAVKVLVRAAEDPEVAPIVASGTRTNSSEFVVEVQTSAGKQTHIRGWEELAIDLAAADQ